MHVLRFLSLAASLAAVFPTALLAQDWELLGTRLVSFRAEKDVVPVTAREGAFRTIKVEVNGGNLYAKQGERSEPGETGERSKEKGEH